MLDGASLMTNARHLRGSAWLNFNRLICGSWSHFNGRSHVVLMGDAAHTAHFAIGSGTKLAIDDAIELARQFDTLGMVRSRFPPCWRAMRRSAAWTWRASRMRRAMPWNGSRWWAGAMRTALSRTVSCIPCSPATQRISHENLRLRDKAWLEGYERWFAQKSGLPATTNGRVLPPMFTPYSLRGVTLANRIVVSPMAMYSARTPLDDFHMVHLGARAMGGAGLVFAKMTCVSPDARITPGCLGLWEDGQIAGWKRFVDFVHTNTAAKVACQLGHAGRKGATRRAWDGIDQPLEEGGWPLLSASPLPYLKHSVVPKEMDRADMDRVRDDFVAAARRADAAGWTGWNCTPPTATCSPASSRPSPTGARTNMAAATRTARASAGSVPRHPRRVAGGQAHLGAPFLP